MSWFSEVKIHQSWLIINDLSSYKAACQKSYEEPILIFKHSTRCSISTMALNRIESFSKENRIISNCYYLDLLKHRELSNLIADDFQVIHASPQILVIKKGKCVYNTSHSNINWRNIKL
tara:strand:+ start:604 stop:960 length:357 start_codon:yes stop_codon:yes gene_type:complete